jgi:hypothetical protein
MRNVIEIYAPWMSEREAEGLIQQVAQIPPKLRRRKAEYLGQRFNLTNDQRERLAIRTIRPCDLTDERLKDRRNARRNERLKRKRLREGRKNRADYLTSSLSRTKPWLKEGISRRTWERRRRLTTRVASMCPHKLFRSEHIPASQQQGAKPAKRVP